MGQSAETPGHGTPMLTQHFCISVRAQAFTAVGWTNGIRRKIQQENCAGVKTVTHGQRHGQEELVSLYLQIVNKMAHC